MRKEYLPPQYTEPVEKLQEAAEVGNITVDEAKIYQDAYLNSLTRGREDERDPD